jgi:hypothetical protein
MQRAPCLTASVALLALAVTYGTAGAARAQEIPLPACLDAAAVRQDRLDSIYDRAIILGNGDINALLYSDGGQLVLRLTKNDVWDARVDTSADPPLLTIDVQAKKLDGPNVGKGPWRTPSWDKPYPCPRACAHVYLGGGSSKPVWQPIRAQGRRNAWEVRDGAAVMSIEGKPGDSNGYAYGPLDVSTDECPGLKVLLSGTPNARFFVDVMDRDNKPIFGSKWRDSPAQPAEQYFDLPPGKKATRIILYTWTQDGQRAENRFQDVYFEGKRKRVAVLLRAPAAGEAAPCPAVLDIRRAVARVEGAEAGPPTAVARALAQRNAFLIETSADARLEAIASPVLPAAETLRRDGVEWLMQQMPGDPDWPGMTFAVALASDGDRKAVAIVTSLESKDVVADAVALARSTLAANAAALVQEHEAVWQQFWSASGVDLEDTALRDVWYRNLYFMRCVSKPGVEAVGLYAGLVNDHPAWHGGHTINYNTQQTFWASYSTNHAELAEPYERLIVRYLPRARWFCRQTYGFGGAYLPHNLFAHEPPDPETCQSKNGRMHAFSPYAYTIGNSGYATQNLWLHYKYQPDRQYLEKTAYPAVRDVAVFYAEFVERCETGPSGKIVLAPTYSPEHWYLSADYARSRNCAYCLAFVRFTLAAAIEGAAALGRDARLAARFQKALDRLPPYPTTKADPSLVVDVEDAPPITYNIAVPAVPVFPGDHITWFSGEPEKQLFARTLSELKWNGNNSVMILGVARARLSMPGTADWMRSEFAARQRPNGTLTLNRLGHGLNNNGHYTEQFAAAGAVSELLLQSVGDILRVFPAWPKERPARFTDLRAQGGFLVSAEQAGGQVVKLQITSTVGGTLRLLSPWKEVRVGRSPGRPATVALKPDARGVVEVDTRPGERLAFGGPQESTQ